MSLKIFLTILVACGLVEAHQIATTVNHCLTSALRQKPQDLRNDIFEQCINSQIQDENVSFPIILQ